MSSNITTLIYKVQIMPADVHQRPCKAYSLSELAESQTGRHRSILEPFGCSSFSLQCTTLMCTSSTRTVPPCHPSFAISPSSQHQSSYAARCCRLNMAYAADHGQLHDSHTGVLLLAAEQWALCQKKQPSPMLISSFPVEYSRMTNLQGSQTTISVSSEKSSAAQ